MKLGSDSETRDDVSWTVCCGLVAGKLTNDPQSTNDDPDNFLGGAGLLSLLSDQTPNKEQSRQHEEEVASVCECEGCNPRGQQCLEKKCAPLPPAPMPPAVRAQLIAHRMKMGLSDSKLGIRDSSTPDDYYPGSRGLLHEMRDTLLKILQKTACEKKAEGQLSGTCHLINFAVGVTNMVKMKR